MKWVSCVFRLLAFCILLNLISSPLVAGMFRCENSKGEIEFRDRPCQTSIEEETFLPIAYKKTIPDKALDDKQKAKEQKAIKAEMEKITREQNKEKRLQQRQLAKRLKEQEKEEKRHKRCVRIEEKMQKIEAELRHGCSIKRYKKLEEEKEHCYKMKRRYCMNEEKSL